MKKAVIIALAAFLLFPLMLEAQSKAIGLRLGVGVYRMTEISYQTPFGGERLELDLGWGGNNNWSYLHVVGIYQWVRPIESGFYWYAGLGPSLGSWTHRGKENYSNEIVLALALNGGVEYNFEEIPLQLSLDMRPEIRLSRHSTHGVGLALGIRYKF